MIMRQRRRRGTCRERACAPSLLLLLLLTWALLLGCVPAPVEGARVLGLPLGSTCHVCACLPACLPAPVSPATPHHTHRPPPMAAAHGEGGRRGGLARDGQGAGAGAEPAAGATRCVARHHLHHAATHTAQHHRTTNDRHTAVHLEELRRLRKLRAAEHAEYQKAALKQAQELERVTEKVRVAHVCVCVCDWGWQYESLTQHLLCGTGDRCGRRRRWRRSRC